MELDIVHNTVQSASLARDFMSVPRARFGNSISLEPLEEMGCNDETT